MLKTPLCELLGISYPIFQGGMAWVSEAELAAAVSNAGGLGIIGSGSAPADLVRAEIIKAKNLTDKPFGLNIMLKSPYAAEVAEIAAAERVAVLTTGAGSPVKYMKMWLDAGIKVIPVVPSTAIAKLVERSGACAVVAEGGESGGHIGELSTMALVPQVVDAVGIPVIAAGGIANGRGFAAALMLGAVGVQLGTRFLVARECRIHPNYKKRILKARDIDTITTGKRLGHPVRSLKTLFSLDYFAKEYDATISDEELEALGVGALRLAAVEGDEQNGCFLAGQAAAMVSREQSAQEIIDELISDAEKVLKEAGKWLK